MEEAKSLLAEMSHKALPPDTVTYNTLMQGLCQVGRPQEALNLFMEMCSYGLLPDLTTYSILLDGFCKHGHLDEALKLLKAMQEKKLEPNIILYNILIEGMFIAGKLVVAEELFSRLFVDGIRPTLQTYSVMIKGLLKEGLSDEAYKLFRKMEDDGFTPDSCSYNVIIQGFLQNRDSSTAVQFIDEMVGKGFSADSSTFQMLLDLESHDEIISRFLRGSSLDVYLSGPIRKYIEDKGGRFHLRWGCRQILYDRSPDGEYLSQTCHVEGSRLVHQTSEKSDCATDKKVVKADAYVVVEGIKFFDNIYELVSTCCDSKLRYNGWVTELQDLERSRQLRQASGLDNLLYTPDADFSCFADLALTSPEDYYIEGQGHRNQLAWEVLEFKNVLALFPSSQGLEVIWSSVVKIAQSLYREGPGKDPFRPDQKTPVKNFFLAGSYTKQGVRQQAALASNKFDRNHSS
uniref:Amine oxidase domain-containing protein n=1 Tax=Salix viminalis TaxID=40686 RepID=A0A6N2MK82_SALVM